MSAKQCRACAPRRCVLVLIAALVLQQGCGDPLGRHGGGRDEGDRVKVGPYLLDERVDSRVGQRPERGGEAEVVPDHLGCYEYLPSYVAVRIAA